MRFQNEKAGLTRTLFVIAETKEEAEVLRKFDGTDQTTTVSVEKSLHYRYPHMEIKKRS